MRRIGPQNTNCTRAVRIVLAVLLANTLCHSPVADQVALAQKTSRVIQTNRRENRDQGPKFEISKVDPQTKDQVAKSAEMIDRLVEANYQRFNVTPNSRTNDEQFVRRIYLDITGTIPNYEQVTAFRRSRKRAELIDDLLNSPGYASHMYNYFANLLRLVDRPHPNIIGDPYIDWIKQSVRDNMPYDKMVHEMITADGKIWDDPAAGYWMRDTGMPLDALNNTIQVFMGTQIGCAQCHDHPFDRWKQREFYELAAYTYGIRDRRPSKIAYGKIRDELMQASTGTSGYSTARRLVLANSFHIWENVRQNLKLPHDYAYQDGKPGQVIAPKIPDGFGQAQPVKRGESRRGIFADWLTSANNPRFAGAIANRMWKKAMGVAQIEPVDDIRDDSRPENPPLIRFLVSEMKRVKFDLKEYLRILYNTKTYQREASTTEVAENEVYHFPGPILRRLSAEQVWDSLLTLTVYNPDAILRPTSDGMEKLATLPDDVTAEKLIELGDEFDVKHGRVAMQQMRRDLGYGGLVLARASEQPMPLPPGHFLREFGQGDRQLIEGDTKEGTVPQILTMFNGPITHLMLNNSSVIFDNVMSNRPNERIDVIFQSILGRKPTSAEESIATKEVQSAAKTKKGAGTGYGNIIWALINTREFLFIQ